MSTVKRVLAGCVLAPFVLVAGCFGKMYVDARLYELPGEVLKSSTAPDRKLGSAMQVAEALDAYVQPRFEILRDRNFGAMRIVYRKHAGIVQLKVESPEEQRLIAAVNAADRDYAIQLLHCAQKPDSSYTYHGTPKLEMLYFNQQPVATSWDRPMTGPAKQIAAEHDLDNEQIEKTAVKSIAQLMHGKEVRSGDEHWEVLMRPVLATKQECLSCHASAKPGDTLGVMVYAVGKDHRGPIAIGMR